MHKLSVKDINIEICPTVFLHTALCYHAVSFLSRNHACVIILLRKFF
uniref:Uncharacterized protein n=1 Tax=Rhizophora mucronata TaxID=61149 RepID=A0A2P2PH20_RHIMU